VDSTSTNFNTGDLGTSSNFCHHLQTYQQDLCLETTYIDTILHRIRQYYADVKSKRQLNLEVPAGFCKLTQHQKDYNDVSSSQILPTSSSEMPTVEDIPIESADSNLSSIQVSLHDTSTEIL